MATLVATPAIAAERDFSTMTQDSLLERQLEEDPALFIIDVRTPDEYVAGHVPGAVNIPHYEIADRLAEVPTDKDVILYCRTGRRAEIAAATLAANGHARLALLEGDMPGWQASRLPTQIPRDPAACAVALTQRQPDPESCAL
jgi:rhodanese-related sulfurtransferase